MADISKGPVVTLRGARAALPEGAMCDTHPSRKAVARVQGETDSFGCEYDDMCAECLKELRSYLNSAESQTGECDWCKREATDLRDARDYDEGLSGRVYRVCGGCRQRQRERLEEESRDYEYDGGDWE